ncbi:MAG: hypothetical protein WC322_02920 [Candidatus Paceibacterota bacterium]
MDNQSLPQDQVPAVTTTREPVTHADGTLFTFRDADGKIRYAYREVNNDVQPGGARDDSNND